MQSSSSSGGESPDGNTRLKGRDDLRHVLEHARQPHFIEQADERKSILKQMTKNLDKSPRTYLDQERKRLFEELKLDKGSSQLRASEALPISI